MGQCGTHVGEAAESFAAAGGAEEESRLHDSFSRKGAKAQSNLFSVGRCNPRHLSRLTFSPRFEIGCIAEADLLRQWHIGFPS